MRFRLTRAALMATILVIATLFTGARPASAQQLMAIASLVNDEVISRFDVEQRMRWMALRGRRPTNEREMQLLRRSALKLLEEELLLIQDVESVGVEISEEMIDARFAELAQSANMSPVNLIDRLRQAQVDISTVRREAKAYLARSFLVNNRLRRQATVSEEDVDEKLAELSRLQGGFRYQVLEIVLKRETGETDSGFEGRARQIADQVTSPRKFLEVARTFSKGPTASSGGQVDWVVPGQLDSALDNVLTEMQVGQVSELIPTDDDTLVMLLLADRRRVFSEDYAATQVQLSQLLIPLGQNAPAQDVQLALDRASTIRSEIEDCVGLPKIASRHAGTQAASLGLLRIGELPEPLRSAVAELNAGELSEPVRTAAGLNILVVCGRDKPAGGDPNRERVKSQLVNEKIKGRLDTYLRDLRRNATIERR